MSPLGPPLSFRHSTRAACGSGGVPQETFADQSTGTAESATRRISARLCGFSLLTIPLRARHILGNFHALGLGVSQPPRRGFDLTQNQQNPRPDKARERVNTPRPRLNPRPNKQPRQHAQQREAVEVRSFGSVIEHCGPSKNQDPITRKRTIKNKNKLQPVPSDLNTSENRAAANAFFHPLPSATTGEKSLRAEKNEDTGKIL